MTTTDARAREFARLVAHHLVHHARKDGKTAKALAGAIGIHPVTLSKYIHGKAAGTVTAEMLVTGAEWIGVEPSLIVSRAYEDLIAKLGPAPPVAPASSSPQADSAATDAQAPGVDMPPRTGPKVVQPPRRTASSRDRKRHESN